MSRQHTSQEDAMASRRAAQTDSPFPANQRQEQQPQQQPRRHGLHPQQSQHHQVPDRRNESGHAPFNSSYSLDDSRFHASLHSQTSLSDEGSVRDSDVEVNGDHLDDNDDSSTVFIAEEGAVGDVDTESSLSMHTPASQSAPGHLGTAGLGSVPRQAAAVTAASAPWSSTARQSSSRGGLSVPTGVTVHYPIVVSPSGGAGRPPGSPQRSGNTSASNSNYNLVQPPQHQQQRRRDNLARSGRVTSPASPSSSIDALRASAGSLGNHHHKHSHNYDNNSCAASGGQDAGQRRRRGRGRPTRSAEGSPFLSTGRAALSFPQPMSTSQALPHHHRQPSLADRAVPKLHQAEEKPKHVNYGTQRQSPPVCASSTTSSRDWVRLNVGGRTFVSTFATLCSDPNSVLTQICEPLLASRRRAAGEEQHLRQQQQEQQQRQQQQQDGCPDVGIVPPAEAETNRRQASSTPASPLAGEREESTSAAREDSNRNDVATVDSNSSGGGAAADRTPGGASQSGGAPLQVTPPAAAAALLATHVGAIAGGNNISNDVARRDEDGADPLPVRRQPRPSHADPYGSVAGSASPPSPSSPGAGGGGPRARVDNDAGGGELANPGSEDALALAPLDVDEHNSILLDLDPDYFAPILNYLRHRTVIIPPSLSARGVLAVAEYLNVQGMVRQLAPERRVKRQVLSSWGSGGSGELGTQRFQDSDAPTPVQVTPFGVKVVHMALGANYSCALSDDGNIYTFGNGDWGQLGLGSPKDLDVHPTDKSAVVVVPRRIPLFEKHRALHVSAGYAFAMAIINDYHVYFWGNNNHGQSGLGPRFFDYNTRKVDEPKLVDTLEGKRIVQLGCGSFFSLALGEDGTLYSWGLMECLGLGTPDEVRRKYQDTNILGESLSNEKRGVVLTPQVVNIRGSSTHRIVRIHAGQWHSGAINSAGELFTWGVGYQGRLGHGSKDPAYVPTKVRGAIASHRVVDVACGSFHTVALTDRGAVFCWGDNASGQCGTSATYAEAVTSPYRVVGLEFIAGGVAKGISCGRQHTVVVMEGPQPGCSGPCCQLDYRGRPYHAHAQVYTFGESARCRSGAGGATSSTTAAAAAAVTGSMIIGSANSPSGNSSAGHGGSAGGVAGSGGHGTAVGGGLLGRAGRGGGTLGDAYGSGGRTCLQYQLVPGLERMNVVGVVSGLHHTFVYAEEIESAPQQQGGAGEDGDVLLASGGGYCGGPATNAWPSSGAGYDAQRQWRFAQEGWGGGGGGPGAGNSASFARN